MQSPRTLVYLLRRDLRVADNPILYEVSRLAKQSPSAFTHFLPLYVFSAPQIEISGFIPSADARCPYPEARSPVGGFWRCGPHRARFLAEAVWDLKSGLEEVGSGLEVRVGQILDVVTSLVANDGQRKGEIVGIWMTGEEGVEEKREERDVRRVATEHGVEFKLWSDEKYLVDDRDLPFQKPHQLPDVFTSYRKMVEPLRGAPRRTLPKPQSLPPLPPSSAIPTQFKPFAVPATLDGTVDALLAPLQQDLGLKHPPARPDGVRSAHPFRGGEQAGHERVRHLLTSGAMTAYKETRNGLLGLDFSTKLSAWLALGCLTARQTHEYLVAFEDGTSELGRAADGYGKGENRGTAAVRFELLWRDYMRLCTRKFGPRLFRVEGFRDDTSVSWHSPHKDVETRKKVERFLEGTTGMGLIDASMRELFLTGWTSNRARQNVASFLAKHLGIDWRVGAEWYEMLLTDYDVSSNWGNWQYTAGVGNDPRGEGRVFNPVKQAFDYDHNGEYTKAWVPELRRLDHAAMVFQAWQVPTEQRRTLGLEGLEWVEKPLKRIDYHGGKGRGRGGGGGGGGGRSRGQYRGQGRGRGRGRRGAMDRVRAADEAATS
ncbi:MAG: hypothetical protein M1838_002054 [Thelocarpon superellum]|nr:MAG: hypothetical protein M1838_002054 [Thelocarpon superellum]